MRSVSDASGASNTLAAGEFSAWLAEVRDALRGAHDADVPCNGCTACCTSSQFIPIAPNETDTIAHIPKPLLFPAPRMPGHYVLGYDERALSDARRRCLHDLRPPAAHLPHVRLSVLAAADLTLDDDAKEAIAERVARWRFSHPTAQDETRAAGRTGPRPRSCAMSFRRTPPSGRSSQSSCTRNSWTGRRRPTPTPCACGSARLPRAQPRRLRPTLGGGHQRKHGRAVDRLAHDVGVARVARGLGGDVQEHPPH